MLSVSKYPTHCLKKEYVPISHSFLSGGCFMNIILSRNKAARQIGNTSGPRLSSTDEKDCLGSKEVGSSELKPDEDRGPA